MPTSVGYRWRLPERCPSPVEGGVAFEARAYGPTGVIDTANAGEFVPSIGIANRQGVSTMTEVLLPAGTRTRAAQRKPTRVETVAMTLRNEILLGSRYPRERLAELDLAEQ